MILIAVGVPLLFGFLFDRSAQIREKDGRMVVLFDHSRGRPREIFNFSRTLLLAIMDFDPPPQGVQFAKVFFRHFFFRCNYLGIPIWFVQIKGERQPNPLKK